MQCRGWRHNSRKTMKGLPLERVTERPERPSVQLSSQTATKLASPRENEVWKIF